MLTSTDAIAIGTPTHLIFGWLTARRHTVRLEISRPGQLRRVRRAVEAWLYGETRIVWIPSPRMARCVSPYLPPDCELRVLDVDPPTLDGIRRYLNETFDVHRVRECVLCMEDLSARPMVVARCSDTFHADCLHEYIEFRRRVLHHRNPVCIQCRQELPPYSCARCYRPPNPPVYPVEDDE